MVEEMRRLETLNEECADLFAEKSLRYLIERMDFATAEMAKKMQSLWSNVDAVTAHLV